MRMHSSQGGAHALPGERGVAALWPAKSTELVGESRVLRALPRVELRRVGPFVFCDHFGPAPSVREVMDVPAHPHVGLQTVTYLFSGSIRHRDSVGSVQDIHPGDVNWMTAGRGIVHAEEVHTGPDAPPLHGVQTWVALPREHRNTEPAFTHTPASELPLWERPGARVRVIAGRLGDAESPVSTFHPLTYLDVELSAGADVSLPVDPSHALALYVAQGQVSVGGKSVDRGVLAHLDEGTPSLPLQSQQGARLLVLGGLPLPDPLVIWWNFVVDSVAEGRARFADWEAGRFPSLAP
ncbi:pirin family protein [Pyxidicoccus fallax]|uniref:Pirin family protein n=1 Tax=Pyxidicoccus fallax TaxID=394095 RepID=A0A848LAY4_9BACT|nr:pirin family protein [Pyxidicoccus fallax]NMO15787.1 pirin family protein [Pyxidicoccus fallax]NPC77325.1 pirin family protein [Pyxidicoccus fallax]